MITVARKTTITLGLMAIAVGSVWPVQAQMMTEENLNPLPQSEGSAADLAGILPKDSALWLGGVGEKGISMPRETIVPTKFVPTNLKDN
ncbi:hypothetical protein NON20_09390 [Synechocystis sp. B12]|nr:hypothetical protein NON20_09390 [Synechocystis sp. B12]